MSDSKRAVVGEGVLVAVPKHCESFVDVLPVLLDEKGFWCTCVRELL